LFENTAKICIKSVNDPFYRKERNFFLLIQWALLTSSGIHTITIVIGFIYSGKK